jgi:hypothetical protein
MPLEQCSDCGTEISATAKAAQSVGVIFTASGRTKLLLVN